jgi:hypothetical protein
MLLFQEGDLLHPFFPKEASMHRFGLRVASTALALAICVPAFAGDSKKKVVTITGAVVSVEPGRTIVVRQPDSQEVTYTLTPDITLPSDVAVGRTVTVYAEPDATGAMVLRRVTTVTTASGETRQTTTTVTGAEAEAAIAADVVRFEPNSRLIVVREPQRGEMTYYFAPDVTLPTEVAVGRKVTVYTTRGADGKTFVRRVVTINP